MAISKKRGNGHVLVAGGAGYIGSHMARALLRSGYRVTVIDNLSTGHRNAVPQAARFVRGDLRKESDLEKVLNGGAIDAVLYFAALSIIPESVRFPQRYYDNNVVSCLRLLEAMARRHVRKIVFSSTAAVYGEPVRIPIGEDHPTAPVNPYGRSKLMMEEILLDEARAGRIQTVILRYFNAAGAHPLGEVGESHEPETHLVPNVLKALAGRKKEIVITGGDYPTPDGTCIRDYVHVEDLCDAHLAALTYLDGMGESGVFNLGSGKGHSVREVIRSAEKITGRSARVRIGPRRPGDPARLVALAEKAKKVLGWTPRRSLEDMLESAWKYERDGRRA